MTFLVDVNLPRALWQSVAEEFIFVFKLNRELSDTEIWDLALKNNYIILTKDMDFYFKAKESIEFPKIIIFRFGNLKLNAMRQYLNVNWKSICELIEKNKLLFAGQHDLEIVY